MTDSSHEPMRPSRGAGLNGRLLGCLEAVSRASSSLVAVVGLAVLLGWYFDIELLRAGLPGRTPVNPATALGLLLAACALWMHNSPWGSRRALEQSVALVPIAVALISLLGYAYSAEGMYGLGELQRMALPTAASLLMLSIGILCARPDSGFMSVIVSDHAGGVLARRMLPVAILVPAGLGWLTLAGQRAALFSDALGLA